jgi:hypothetical protein
MEYLGKIERVPSRIYKNIDSARKFYEPVVFEFEDDDAFNAFFFKTNKLFSDPSDKNNGKCIVEDYEKCKHIIDVEQINLSHHRLSAEVFVCGVKKIK